MPPLPSWETIAYGPSVVPGDRVMDAGGDYGFRYTACNPQITTIRGEMTRTDTVVFCGHAASWSLSP